MDAYRKLNLDCLKLTEAESQNGSYEPSNPTWLAEHRTFPQYHPYYQGPFNSENVCYYHVNCSMELWLELGGTKNWHWSYVTPIRLRKKLYALTHLRSEIFDKMDSFYVTPETED